MRSIGGETRRNAIDAASNAAAAHSFETHSSPDAVAKTSAASLCAPAAARNKERECETRHVHAAVSDVTRGSFVVFDGDDGDDVLRCAATAASKAESMSRRASRESGISDVEFPPLRAPEHASASARLSCAHAKCRNALSALKSLCNRR